MLIVVLSGLIVSCLLILFGKFIRNNSAILNILPLALFVYFCTHINEIRNGDIVLETYKWIPSLDSNASFRLDGLSLLFSLLITGIGFLVFLYAGSYLKGHKYLDRFYGYLCIFMSAMLGMVLSDNILLLFVFWELTSISSFFLIGFNNDSKESRKSAITSLAITGMGGFFLLTGVIIIANITGTYSITELLASGDVLKNHNLYPLLLVCIFIAAFTKSAQFPFHFWLPGAMKAPTPVSAYLHSATMVKAGIFLLARMTPILGGTAEWSYTLMAVGGFTMIFAAVHSLFRTDLKAILAYSTIAALGMLTFLLGLGTDEALIAVCVFIVVHALYKAALFLITGIIDHQAGTRDITKLAGLKKVLLPVYIAGILAALSSAGLPFTFGFIGKDLIYEATLNAASPIALYLTIAVVATNICLVAAGFMAGIKPFHGRMPDTFADVKLPPASQWLPALLLGITGFVLGCFPALIGGALISPMVNALTEGSALPPLKIWHGFNTVLLLSGITLVAGNIVFLINKPSSGLALQERYKNISPQFAYTRLKKDLYYFSQWYTGIMHNGFLRSYILKIILFAQLLFIYELVRGGPIYFDYSKLSSVSVYEGATVLFLIGGLYMALTTSSRLTAVVGTSVIGYAICLLFLFFSAPDLAITQFTIDTLIVVLFVLVLFNLPPFIKFPGMNKNIVIRDVFIAVSFGTIMSLIAIKVLQVPTQTATSDFYGTYAYALARGKNVVNVILVDFRGVDTMFEIVVLAIAAIGVYSLLKLRLKSSEKE